MGLLKKYAKKALKHANPVNAIKALNPKSAIKQVKNIAGDFKELGQDIGLVKKKEAAVTPVEEFVRPSGKFPGVATVQGSGTAPTTPTVVNPEPVAPVAPVVRPARGRGVKLPGLYPKGAKQTGLAAGMAKTQNMITGTPTTDPSKMRIRKMF